MIQMSKKRSRVILLAILSVIIIIVAFIIFTYLGSQSDLVAAPGVKAGDEFTYDIEGFWSSQDPDAVPPESFLN
jgi:flagellar basal body-associated protein FliL